jgi:hypothetical protein
MWNDLGYSLSIPANAVYNTGWQFSKPDIWGYERKLITDPRPEWYAPDNVVRTTGGIPEINTHDPKYTFSRAEHTYDV